jgi:hypothetical protein
MLEINHVHLPRPHENAPVHMQAVFQLRCACWSLPHEVRWGGIRSQGVFRTTSGTNGVLLNSPRSTQLTQALGG